MITHLSTAPTVQQYWIDIKSQFMQKRTGQFEALMKEFKTGLI